MLDPQQFHGADRWQNHAINELCPHLERALSSGSPAKVNPFPTALSQTEVIEVAVRICRQAGAAVLAGPGRGVTLVPLRPPSPAPKEAVSRPRRRTRLEMTAFAEVWI